jgi:hypothetical protein
MPGSVFCCLGIVPVSAAVGARSKRRRRFDTDPSSLATQLMAISLWIVIGRGFPAAFSLGSWRSNQLEKVERPADADPVNFRNG